VSTSKSTLAALGLNWDIRGGKPASADDTFSGKLRANIEPCSAGPNFVTGRTRTADPHLHIHDVHELSLSLLVTETNYTFYNIQRVSKVLQCREEVRCSGSFRKPLNYVKRSQVSERKLGKRGANIMGAIRAIFVF
jgi:hypothetical protein